MPRPIHFEIHSDQPERAIAFYSGLFGWQFTKWEGGPMAYWMIVTGPNSEPGINGGLLARQCGSPAEMSPMNAFVCTVDTTDLDGLLAKATGLGASVAVPKMPIPGVGWLAYLKDTEGNIFGMMQPDPAATGCGDSVPA